MLVDVVDWSVSYDEQTDTVKSIIVAVMASTPTSKTPLAQNNNFDVERIWEFQGVRIIQTLEYTLLPIHSPAFDYNNSLVTLSEII